MPSSAPLSRRSGTPPVLGLWVAIALASAALQFAGLRAVLQYDRARIVAGEWWRLLSGCFVHVNWSHWLLNMAGLAAIAVFFSRYGTLTRWTVVVIAAALAVGAGSFLFDPELLRMAGLSGVLHGLFFYGVLHELSRHRVAGLVLLALLTVKLVWEFFQGAVPGSEEIIGVRVATAAHLYGALAGLLVWCLERCLAPGR